MHSDKFFQELEQSDSVWTTKDHNGIPARVSADGQRSMPFWSRESRVLKIIATVDAFAGFHSSDIPLVDWIDRWLPGLAQDGLLVGLNWSGERATGYDIEPQSVLDRLRISRRL